MSAHLSKEISRLKRYVLQLCAMVEENVRHAVDAVANRDVCLARAVISKDTEIDRFEIDVEEECLKILALHQPVAVDLRFVIACLKMNNDLERIGDLAVNIAKRALAIAEHGDDPVLLDFYPMMDKTQAMLKKTLDSLIDMNADLAIEVLAEDDEIDAMNKKMRKEVNELIRHNPPKSDYYSTLASVAKHLERIGDYATNIAEDVIYMVKGVIVRHKTGGDLANLKENPKTADSE